MAIFRFLRGRVKTHVPMLQVWTAEKPHPQEEVRDWNNCISLYCLESHFNGTVEVTSSDHFGLSPHVIKMCSSVRSCLLFYLPELSVISHDVKIEKLLVETIFWTFSAVSP